MSCIEIGASKLMKDLFISLRLYNLLAGKKNPLILEMELDKELKLSIQRAMAEVKRDLSLSPIV